MTQASGHMLEAFGNGVGSPELECVCGRAHCAPDSEFIEPSEAQQMRARHAKNPDHVILHEGVDGVSARLVNGATAVDDCECNYLAKVEAILWHHRLNILDYYRRRRDADIERAAELEKAMLRATGQKP